MPDCYQHRLATACSQNGGTRDGVIDEAALWWLVDGWVNRKLSVECKPTAVTTLRATPNSRRNPKHRQCKVPVIA